MSRVVIVVEGGVVQSVLVDSEHTKVLLIDHDEDGPMPVRMIATVDYDTIDTAFEEVYDG